MELLYITTLHVTCQEKISGSYSRKMISIIALMCPAHFRTTFRLISMLFIAAALFSLSGGHWALLQSVAWVNMVRTYSSQSSLSSAVEKTFSGKYRCALCKKIEQAKQQEKKNSFVTEMFKKREAVLKLPLSLPKIFSTRFSYARLKSENGSIRTIEPLLPPPRNIS